jgi:hypothetical protein
LEGLHATVKQSGWQVEETASLKLIASIKPGRTQKIYFPPLPPGAGLLNVPPAGTELVEVKPMNSRLEIRESTQNDRVIYSTESPRLTARTSRPGESKEAFIERFQRAQPEFFRGVEIPTRIPYAPAPGFKGYSSDESGVWVDSPSGG